MRAEDEDVPPHGNPLMLEGLYRHASTHAAGVVIGDRPLNRWSPSIEILARRCLVSSSA